MTGYNTSIYKDIPTNSHKTRPRKKLQHRIQETKLTLGYYHGREETRPKDGQVRARPGCHVGERHLAQAVEVMRQCGIAQSSRRVRGSSRRISFGHQLSDPSNKAKGDATSLEEISFGFRQSSGSSQNSKDIQPPVTKEKQTHEEEFAV